MKNRLWWIALIVVWTGSQLHSQIVYEPLHRDIYTFLSRLAQKGVIDYDDLIKPIPRTVIAAKLLELANAIERLTPLERKELAFFEKDFFVEIEILKKRKAPEVEFSYLRKDAGHRFRFFAYRDSLFTLNGSPIYGYKIGSNDGEKNTHRWNGIYLYGYLTDVIGYSFDFRDNREEGKNVDLKKAFTPTTGVVTDPFVDSTAFEYSETHTMLTARWKWGSVALGKDFMEWGYAQNGKLTLSTKAPSFPFVRLDIFPTNWLHFNYFHGWLNSNVIDSTKTYNTLNPDQERIQFRPKYIASHTLILRPLKGLYLAVGESIIYSEELEIAYLMPLMFFRLADHYLADKDNRAGNNAQIFFALSSRNHIPNCHLYGELFIDDLSVPNISNPDKAVNYFGWTNGISLTDFPLNNLTATLEYTRVNPFVYRHFIQTITYRNSDYNLGHWMNDNDDLLYGSLNYRFLRGLQATVWAQKIRKGAEPTIEQQYTLPHPPFLFGLRTNYTYLGVDLKYEIIHELFLRAEFQHVTTSAQQEGGSFLDTKKNEFFISLYYGL